jgi:hypothetical protein
MLILIENSFFTSRKFISPEHLFDPTLCFIFSFRDEDDQDDFEERIALKLAEQEEDNLDRIKEESRKRRDAILEKYRNQQLQQLKESGSKDADKSTFPFLQLHFYTVL